MNTLGTAVFSTLQQQLLLPLLVLLRTDCMKPPPLTAAPLVDPSFPIHRKADELEFLAPRLFAMAEALGLDLSVKLFCTGVNNSSSSSSSN